MTGINITAAGGIGAKVFEATTGQEIMGVTRLSVEFASDDYALAQVEIAAAGIEVEGAVATFLVVDPATGDPKPVKRIEYEDGTSWACAPEGRPAA